MARMGAAGAA